MSLPPVLPDISARLEKAGIPHMLTGSFASAFYGAPRSTQALTL